MERQYTRIDSVRNILDEQIKKIENEELKRCAYVHLYGVGQAAAFLAMKRGYERAEAELAEIAGMLHDYTKYIEHSEEDHAHRSAQAARELLKTSGVFSGDEIEQIYHAIYCHSDKTSVDNCFDEILKDADEMQHCFRNPTEEYFFSKPRVQKLLVELIDDKKC